MWVADRVDEALAAVTASSTASRRRGRRANASSSPSRARPAASAVIRRAARMAARTKGELIGVHVRPSDGLTASGRPDGWSAQRRLLDELGGAYHEVVGADVAGTLVRFARSENATQIVLGATQRSPLDRAPARLGHQLGDPRVGPDRRARHLARGSAARARTPIRRRGGSLDTVALAAAPTAVAWVLAVGGPILLTVVLAAMRELGEPADGPAALPAAHGRRRRDRRDRAGAASRRWAASCCANWYFTPPLHTFTIEDGDNIASLVVFVVIAAVVSALVSVAARRTREAAVARADAETLAGLSGRGRGGRRPAARDRRAAA